MPGHAAGGGGGQIRYAGNGGIWNMSRLIRVSLGILLSTDIVGCCVCSGVVLFHILCLSTRQSIIAD